MVSAPFFKYAHTQKQRVRDKRKLQNLVYILDWALRWKVLTAV